MHENDEKKWPQNLVIQPKDNRYNIHGATFHSQKYFFLCTRNVLSMEISKGEPELYQLNAQKPDNAIFNAVLHSYLLSYPT